MVKRRRMRTSPPRFCGKTWTKWETEPLWQRRRQPACLGWPESWEASGKSSEIEDRKSVCRESVWRFVTARWKHTFQMSTDVVVVVVDENFWQQFDRAKNGSCKSLRSDQLGLLLWTRLHPDDMDARLWEENRLTEAKKRHPCWKTRVLFAVSVVGVDVEPLFLRKNKWG